MSNTPTIGRHAHPTPNASLITGALSTCGRTKVNSNQVSVAGTRPSATTKPAPTTSLMEENFNTFAVKHSSQKVQLFQSHSALRSPTSSHLSNIEKSARWMVTAQAIGNSAPRFIGKAPTMVSRTPTVFRATTGDGMSAQVQISPPRMTIIRTRNSRTTPRSDAQKVDREVKDPTTSKNLKSSEAVTSAAAELPCLSSAAPFSSPSTWHFERLYAHSEHS